MYYPPAIHWLLKVAVFLLRQNSRCPRLQPFNTPFGPADPGPCECPTCGLLAEGKKLVGS